MNDAAFGQEYCRKIARRMTICVPLGLSRVQFRLIAACESRWFRNRDRSGGKVVFGAIGVTHPVGRP